MTRFTWIAMLFVCLGAGRLPAAGPQARFEVDPAPGQSFGASGEAAARAYLRQNHKRLGLDRDLTGLALRRVQPNPLGDRVVFQQMWAGAPVDGARAVVLVGHDGGVISVHHSLVHAENAAKRAPQATLGIEAAYEAVWRKLNARGALWDAPAIDLAWRLTDSGLRPVYRVRLALASPFGLWSARVDASDGRVLSLENTAPSRPGVVDAAASETGDRSAAFSAWRAAQAEPQRHKAAGKRASGSAWVFDPDPRTAMADDGLSDDSPAAMFESAYAVRDLLDIAQDGDGYRLDGPHARIVDFDLPEGAPTATADGQWRFPRGERAFLEANAYFHVDQNQRYVQSLGFTGETGLLQRPVEIDVDAAGGDDRSYFAPETGRLGFGRGCVDDAEDADIILHHYALALVQEILPYWNGGDSGAMQRGFADYWAASYSYGAPNGRDFHPERVFGWDGHNACWPGRRLTTDAVYDPDFRYGAEQWLPEGSWASELWGAPLFEAMRELVDRGFPRRDADLIALQSLFFIGDNATMPEMARAVLTAAGELFPEGPHADIYREAFDRYEMLDDIELPDPAFETFFTVVEAGVNGAPDPGETISVSFFISVPGNSPALLGATAKVETDADFVDLVGADVFDLGDLQSGGTYFFPDAFQIEIGAEAECGAAIPLSLRARFEDRNGATYVKNAVGQVRLGFPLHYARETGETVQIPDNDAAGVVSSLRIENTDLLYGRPLFVGEDLALTVYISHSWRQDLSLVLESPMGARVALADREAGDDFVLQFNMQTFEALKVLRGEPLDGEWRLHVTDHELFDEGQISNWSLGNNTEPVCEERRPIRGGGQRYFSFIEESDRWRTSLGLINPHDREASLALVGLDASGTPMARVETVLPAKARRFVPVAEWFPQAAAQIRSVLLESELPLQGFVDVIDPAASESFAVPASAGPYQQLVVPHVAEAEIFWTEGRFSSWDFVENIVFNNTGHVAIPSFNIPGLGQVALDLREDLFRGAIEPGDGWFAPGGIAPMTGVEIFGQSPLFTNVAGLALNDATAQTLIMPHLPADKAVWWAGIAMVNFNRDDRFQPVPVNVTATVYDSDGQILATAPLTLEPLTKRVGLLEDFFPDQDVSAGAWVRFDADLPIAGYELFGVYTRDATAGLEALSEGATEQTIAHVEPNADGRWTGIGALNPGDAPVTITFQAYSDAGAPIGEPRAFELAPRVKKIGFAEDFFDVAGADWARVTSDQPIIVFELFGEGGISRVSGLNALR